MRIIFMGTPNFAVESLKELISKKYNIIGVFTQQDKPKGRGYKLEAPEVKTLAIENNLPVFQPKTLKDDETINLIRSLEPDLIVVIAYGKILPKQVLDIPKQGCINIHGSLLPKYRGAAPIQWSVINGEKFAGVTSMFMTEGLDTGDMILKREIQIDPDETSGRLMSRLAPIAAEILIETINSINNKTFVREPQNDNEATWAPVLSKSMSFISFDKPALEVHNLIRGINPWPVAKIGYNDKAIKIFRSKVMEFNEIKGKPGEIIDNQRFIIACQKGSIEFLEIQQDGGKKMMAKDFLLGHKIKIGDFVKTLG